MPSVAPAPVHVQMPHQVAPTIWGVFASVVAGLIISTAIGFVSYIWHNDSRLTALEVAYRDQAAAQVETQNRLLRMENKMDDIRNLFLNHKPKE